MHSSSCNSSILWTSSLFDWLIQLSLFLIKTLRYHLNCSHSRWTCWIRFIFASSSSSLSIAIAWIAKSPSDSTSISYQPCCNKQGKASLSTRNSFEHPLAGRNKRLRHLRDTLRGRTGCMFRSEAGESCKRRSLRDLPAMEGAFGPFQHAECSNDGLCHVWIQSAGRFIAEQNTRVVYELGR